MTSMNYRAVVIPADPTRACRVEQISVGNSWERLRQLVGGAIEAARYDDDAVFWVNETGAFKLPVNWRVTRYVHLHSARAAQFRERGGRFPLDYTIHGDVVLCGSTTDGDEADVPRRFYDTFAVTIRDIGEPGPDIEA